MADLPPALVDMLLLFDPPESPFVGRDGSFEQLFYDVAHELVNRFATLEDTGPVELAELVAALRALVTARKHATSAGCHTVSPAAPTPTQDAYPHPPTLPPFTPDPRLTHISGF